MVVTAVILAAGRGTRMQSSLAKVLHNVGGRPMIIRVLQQAYAAGVRCFVLVVPPGVDGIGVKRAAYTWRYQSGDHDVRLYFVEQHQTLGTGHALRTAADALDRLGAKRVLVLCGDVPLLRATTIRSLIDADATAECTLLSAHVAEPHGFGRIVGTRIVEERDCTAQQRSIQCVNAGVYIFAWPALRRVLPMLTCNNAQREYYLTDTVGLLNKVRIVVHEGDVRECMGVNTPEQLATANALWTTFTENEGSATESHN